MIGGGALDSSVTLDEVFTVLGARRVPIAPELAGYLVLEIAEHADPNGGEVDPKTIFVSEEGTVALVKPRREGHAGDAEASIRAMLARLLDASGSQTPALAAAGKRKNLVGLLALAEELETALIPVNRAAGRRALARLAREVRRVTLGVGRNPLPTAKDASTSSRRTSHVSQPVYAPSEPEAASSPPARPSAHSFSREEDPTTTRGVIPDELLRDARPAVSSEMPTMQFETDSRDPSPSQADVDALILDFGVSGAGERDQARELKAIAGLEPTPAPPAERVRMVPNDQTVESLMAMPSPDTRPARPTGRPRAQSVAAASTPLTPPEPPRTVLSGPKKGKDEARQLPTQPSQLKRTRASVPSAPRMASSRGSGVWLIVALGAITGGTYAVWHLRPTDVDVKASGHASASGPTSTAVPRTPAACKATLKVRNGRPDTLPESASAAGTGAPWRRREDAGGRAARVRCNGQEGFAPKRVVVPALGRHVGHRARREAAIRGGRPARQIGRSRRRERSLARGRSGHRSGRPEGAARPRFTVVATPLAGAEVWMLAGMGPEARIEQLRCDLDFDVLVAGPGTFRKRIRVAAADFATEAPGGPVGAAASPAAKSPTRLAQISAK